MASAGSSFGGGAPTSLTSSVPLGRAAIKEGERRSMRTDIGSRRAIVIFVAGILVTGWADQFRPLRLALRERYLVVCRRDPAAAVVAVEELATVERIRARLARQGRWN